MKKLINLLCLLFCTKSYLLQTYTEKELAEMGIELP
jgi:hypothetical protein